VSRFVIRHSEEREMSKVWIATGLTLALAATSACFGRSAEQKKQEEAMKEAGAKMEAAGKEMEKSGAKAAEGMAAGMDALAKGLGAAAAAANGGKTVEPVSFRDLQTTFVPIAGWEMAKPTGERMTAPFAFSQAEVSYSKGEGRIRVKIVDSAYNGLMLMPFTWMTNLGYEKETSDGYEKATKVGGYPALEKWNSEGKDGEITIVANKRYIVEVHGNNVDDVKVLQSVAESLTLSKLPS
jgi:hypothetical protein